METITILIGGIIKGFQGASPNMLLGSKPKQTKIQLTKREGMNMASYLTQLFLLKTFSHKMQFRTGVEIISLSNILKFWVFKTQQTIKSSNQNKDETVNGFPKPRKLLKQHATFFFFFTVEQIV